MTNTVEQVQALLDEKRGLDLDAANFERWKAIKAEIADIKAEVDLETFGAIRDLEMIALGASENGAASMRQICFCSHRRGSHRTRGCSVGHEQWNKRNRRDDPYCSCQGYIEMAEAKRHEVEKAADREERKANAELWCESCDDEVEELTVKYECSYCGTEFTYADEGTHRCPECGKFASKLDGDFCPGCGDEVTA